MTQLIPSTLEVLEFDYGKPHKRHWIKIMSASGNIIELRDIPDDIDQEINKEIDREILADLGKCYSGHQIKIFDE